MRRVTNWFAVAALAGGLMAQVAVAPVHAAKPIAASATTSQEHVLRIPTPLGSIKLALPFLGSAKAPKHEAKAAAAPAVSAPETAAAPAQAEAPAPKHKLVFIDPGHGASDSGAVHMDGNNADLLEKNMTLDTSLRLANLLRQNGYEVKMTRTTDTTPVDKNESADLRGRLDLANAANADIMVSVHYNGIDNHAVHGTEVWYCSDRPFSDQNAKLANLTVAALARNLQAAGYDTPNRGVKDDAIMGHFAMNGPNNSNASKMPSITGEALFITNDQDAAALVKPQVRQAIAQGYFEAIQQYFGFSS